MTDETSTPTAAAAGPTDSLDRICDKCGYRMGEHIAFTHECPVWEDWYCWECSGLGYFPGSWEWDPEDRECPCCETYSHYSDAELPPPCHQEARILALASGDYHPGFTRWEWDAAREKVAPSSDGQGAKRGGGDGPS